MISAVADGKVYVYSQQHGNGAQSPYYKGETIWVLNATTGQQIWSIPFQGENNGGSGYPEGSVADGEYVNYNMYDNQIYAFGQGPSATTLNAPSAGLSFGQPVVLSGTVLDVSAGTQQNEQKADFPYGVPAASDASESQWMEYVYMQKPEPTNFTGVQVQLYVLDSNGNHRQIGTAMTDTSGTYSLTWTPDIAGNYTVYAQFAGSNSYWPSSAEAHFSVMSATPTSPTPAPQTNLATNADLMTYIVVGVVAMIIAIAIATVIIVTRKRP
jgi:hypothetical protein